MKAKSQSKSKNIPILGLLLATRTRRFATITVVTIAICTIALATLSLAQTEKRIQRTTSSAAKPAGKIAIPQRVTSSRASDRFRRRSARFRDQDGNGLGNQSDRRERRDQGPREWKLRRARQFNGD